MAVFVKEVLESDLAEVSSVQLTSEVHFPIQTVTPRHRRGQILLSGAQL